MINTKPTKLHIKNIKQYKNLLEKWDMWDFAYFDGNDYYFLTLYDHMLKGISGYLILDYEGNVLPFEKAEVPATALNRFNTMIHGAMQEMVPQMLKNMDPYKEVVSLLTQHKSDLIWRDPELASSIEKVIRYTTHALGISKRTEDIVNTLGHLQNIATKEQGYFNNEILNEMRNECIKYNVMMYEYGLNEFELMDDYEKIIKNLNEKPSDIPSSAQKKIIALLTASIQSNKGALTKTMKVFEDEFKEMNVHIDHANLEQSFDKKMERSRVKAFEEKIGPKIRNPK
ncbi:hypothetical protein [Cytobacillus dafuensis]|uniref:Uncharacterized protein n=1 Tax=Cytobacillus dafuensis TaxID=1742359 RepID=A0A5B8Z0V4_CYTDA|nr:hypothetical protein [Cytobacillus dafuensis]QED46421.1 hypothetical protein FSZ17_03580 [Cytobacillus dafuensis]